MATNPITEDECIFCGHWPEKNRWALRDAIQILPLQDQELICDACFATFWQKCAADDPEPKDQSSRPAPAAATATSGAVKAALAT